MYDEYQRNETRANRMYRDRWLTVLLTGISRIDDNGLVLKSMGGFGMYSIHMDFKNDSEVIPLNPGDSVTAVCKAQGWKWDSYLSFTDCRRVRTR